MMLEGTPTAFLLIAAALVVPLLPAGRFRSSWLLFVPIIAGMHILGLPLDSSPSTRFFGFDIELMRVDRLSRIFGLTFCLAAFLGNLYAWHLRDTVQQVAALLYAGAAIGAVFAGDLISLFFYWEGTAIASVFLIWARRTEGAYHTGMRYLIIQISSGVILLAGVAHFHHETGSITFEQMTLGSLATWAIFIAFGIKAAFPLLHNWLQDSYPAATITGTVILSAFTTKLAIYALARGFAGTEILIYIGVVMAVLPIFFAIVEDDLRRVLAYSLNSQLGFMVVGVGIGTQTALNGTASHAFASNLYQPLLFMAVGAILLRTGTARVSELGGLYRTMPLTMLFCLVGAASISAFPLFSGFVSKSMILDEAAGAKMFLVWGGLLLASAGALIHSGIKIPFFMFFAKDSGKRPAEAPRHMLLAMGISAFLCIAIGVFPGPLYALLPYGVDYVPFTKSHVVGQLQLLFFALLAFGLLMRMGLYPLKKRGINLDTDWGYRRVLPQMVQVLGAGVAGLWSAKLGFWKNCCNQIIARLNRSHGLEGRLARTWPIGSMVIWLATILSATLIINFIG